MSDQLIIILTIVAIVLSIAWIFLFAKQVGKKQVPAKSVLISASAVVIILSGITFGLATLDDPIPVEKILLVDAVILCVSVLIGVLYLKFAKTQKPKNLMTTRRLAFLGVMVGLASALMLLGFPVIPGFLFLKVEVSGLIIFMTLLWFDWKTAAIVSLLTNLIHVLMPGTPPVILFLDEGINFLATMMFLLPTVLFLKKKGENQKPAFLTVLILTIAGACLNIVGMTLYNAFINLPLIYHMAMPFQTVVEVFGLFNLLKWGVVALVINLTWRRLYSVRHFGSIEAEE